MSFLRRARMSQRKIPRSGRKSRNLEEKLTEDDEMETDSADVQDIDAIEVEEIATEVEQVEAAESAIGELVEVVEISDTAGGL